MIALYPAINLFTKNLSQKTTKHLGTSPVGTASGNS